MTTPSWTTTPDWHTLRIGGRVMPGVPHVNVKLGSGLDVPKPKGGRRAAIRDDGEPPAEIEITLTLNPEHLADLAKVRDLLRPRVLAGVRDPLTIDHPHTEFWDIRQIVIGPVSSQNPEPGGFWVLTIQAFEWSAGSKPVKKQAKAPKDDAHGANAWAPFAEDVPATTSPANTGAADAFFDTPTPGAAGPFFD